MQYWSRVLTLAAALAALAACSGTVRQGEPAPVVTPGQGADTPAVRDAGAPPDQGTAEVIALRPPAEPAVARPLPAKAVQVLLRRAVSQREAGRLDDAVVSLERALRIEPRNPQLWNQLAHVRARQQKHELVSQLAAKSNALARSDETALKKDNWRLIAAARRELGDMHGATAARHKAARL